MMSSQNLDELDPPAWGEPNYNSYLVKTCHRLRKKPLDEFSVEDLRIMIGQKIGLKYLVPIAVAVLEKNPLAEGDFYPGDLLAAMLKVPATYWQETPSLRSRFSDALAALANVPDSLREAVSAFRNSGAA